MRAAMDRADFWELRARTAQYEGIVERAKAAAQAAIAAKEALVREMGSKYQFDPTRDFSLDDADLTVTQAET